jgi:transcriptional repressor NrdR
MKCPFCGHPDTPVVETRLADDDTQLRRRRKCSACERRFTTYERPEISFPLVVKKNASRVEYQRKKLEDSFHLALRKRPVSSELVDTAIERIEEKLLAPGLREVSSARIGQLVIRELKKMDKVAYVRFASVYQSFDDIDEFKAFLDDVKK